MTTQAMTRFVEAFQRAFSPPFEQGVSLELKTLSNGQQVLRFVIGRRDADFDVETGECVGAGTDLLEEPRNPLKTA